MQLATYIDTPQPKNKADRYADSTIYNYAKIKQNDNPYAANNIHKYATIEHNGDS